MQKNFALYENPAQNISEYFCTLASNIVENTRMCELARNLHL